MEDVIEDELGLGMEVERDEIESIAEEGYGIFGIKNRRETISHAQAHRKIESLVQNGIEIKGEQRDVMIFRSGVDDSPIGKAGADFIMYVEEGEDDRTAEERIFGSKDSSDNLTRHYRSNQDE